MSSADRHECWACGARWPDAEAFYTLRTDEHGKLERHGAAEYRPHGAWSHVTLCVECHHLIRRVLERLRAARFSGVHVGA
jgi:hypothetical protein